MGSDFHQNVLEAALATATSSINGVPRPPAIDLGPEVEVDSHVASLILGCSLRRVQQLCDEDVLREGRDWRRLVPRGHYKLRRRAVMALKLFGAAEHRGNDPS